MRGPQPDVKWEPEDAPANHSLLGQTVSAVPMDTITTLSVSVSLDPPPPPARLQCILLCSALFSLTSATQSPRHVRL